ncbi:hypothetical protein ELQ35_06115 [Peribacillus cavernae]|uniref:Permuted papain-like amidase enzyme, YaeF/YiiX, C92 family n=1 Tax=Peribacillus cavernae TaxID=1674310 RepID=A0A3S0UEW3_9BACI|nr:YiiX/YebB-like N1pC/P60 family cysteine hydrolase [Peribacillus cavernae]MDQ0217640.1 hypothetical protein [Peribacillus cavernae]RUQ29932.1 hypothetical protein ELQ35_06115 [Peribacillus cavernae]
MGTDKFNGIGRIPFEDAKTEILEGDMLFCSGNYLVSELIKKASGSLFSHVALLFYWNGHVFVLESVEDDGVRAVPLSHYLYNYENSKGKYDGEVYIARHEGIASPAFEKEKLKSMFGKAIGLLNRNYDKEEIARIVARIGLGIGKHQDDEAYTCSEFIDECFKEIDIKLSRDPGGFIYPEHIAADPDVKPLFEISG